MSTILGGPRARRAVVASALVIVLALGWTSSAQAQWLRKLPKASRAWVYQPVTTNGRTFSIKVGCSFSNGRGTGFARLWVMQGSTTGTALYVSTDTGLRRVNYVNFTNYLAWAPASGVSADVNYFVRRGARGAPYFYAKTIIVAWNAR